MRVRAAGEADVPTIAAIYAASVRDGTGTFEIDPPDVAEMAARRARILGAGCPYLVAVDANDAVLGFAYAGPFRERPAYRFTLEDSVYVAEGSRGQGTGRALLEAVMYEAARAGFRQMLALIGDAANTGSIRLHEACGFVHTGLMHDVGHKFGRWLDVVVMQRALAGTADEP